MDRLSNDVNDVENVIENFQKQVMEFENNQANQHKLINHELDIIINNMNDDKLIEDYRFWNNIDYQAKINVIPNE